MVLIGCAITFTLACRMDNQRLLLVITVERDWRVVSQDIEMVSLTAVLYENESNSIEIFLVRSASRCVNCLASWTFRFSDRLPEIY